MIDIKQALGQAIAGLVDLSPSARLDAEILLAFVLRKSRTYLHAYPEALLNPKQWQAYQALLARRYKGIPIAYLTGTREFWSLELQVNKNTLIPRPETELLVQLTLDLLTSKQQATILDLGTGSGAIALALASERPAWQLIAIDSNPLAVETALHNSQRLNLTNFQVYCSDWFSAVPARLFDAIVANPPYIAEHDPHLAQGDVRFEPRSALTSGMQGLDAIDRIIKDSYARLQPGGLLLFEHGYDQKLAVLAKLEHTGYQSPQCWQDWQGNDRISGGWRRK